MTEEEKLLETSIDGSPNSYGGAAEVIIIYFIIEKSFY